jgi:hypothetical protein
MCILIILVDPSATESEQGSVRVTDRKEIIHIGMDDDRAPGKKGGANAVDTYTIRRQAPDPTAPPWPLVSVQFESIRKDYYMPHAVARLSRSVYRPND